MLAAAKQEIYPTSADPCVFFPLAADAAELEARFGTAPQLRKNSRLGFARKTVALHQGSTLAKSRTALRDSRSLARNTRRMSLLPQTPTTQKPSLRQQAKDWLGQHPKIKWYICGSNPRGALRAYLIEGAIKGGGIGAIVGGFSGGLPGAGIGLVGGAITGASSGAIVAPFAIGGCSALGAYN